MHSCIYYDCFHVSVCMWDSYCVSSAYIIYFLPLSADKRLWIVGQYCEWEFVHNKRKMFVCMCVCSCFILIMHFLILRQRLWYFWGFVIRDSIINNSMQRIWVAQQNFVTLQIYIVEFHIVRWPDENIIFGFLDVLFT